MALRDRIQADMIAATKARDELKTNCLRMAISAFKYKESDKKAAGREGPLDDAEIQAVLKTLIKQRRDSVEQYEKGNRPDLAGRERAEIEVLEAYLPRPIDDAALAAAVDAAIAETGAAGPKDMGKVIKAVMAKVGGAADGARVSALVKGRLA